MYDTDGVLSAVVSITTAPAVAQVTFFANKNYNFGQLV